MCTINLVPSAEVEILLTTLPIVCRGDVNNFSFKFLNALEAITGWIKKTVRPGISYGLLCMSSLID